MAQDPKLQALKRTYEVQEQQALEEKRKVDAVVEHRRKAVEALRHERDALSDKLADIRSVGRQSALCSGDAARLNSIAAYESRLVQVLRELQTVLAEKEQELSSGLARLTLAEEDLLAARIETKKLERFVEHREQAARVTDAAREEALTDEMNFYRRKK
ncbi:MAG: hypothetical protein KDD69_04890 [Bdellovibrionales bacterium]|nr:hypothetical protein [Bdellovibrionales bacterium]